MDFKLTLGCHARTQPSGFVFCNGVENIIMEIKQGTPKRGEILDFLRSAELNKDAIYDWNKAMNVIGLLKNKFGLINDSQLVEIQMFAKMHRVCGIYLELDII